MNTYDEGKAGEETAIHTREKIGSENKNKVFTEEEKANYLNNLKDKYKNAKSIEQQFAEAKLVDEKDREHFPVLAIGGALLYTYGPEIVEATAKYGPLILSMMIDSPEINKEDEIDNLDDIKNYKTIVISNNKNAEDEKENKDEQVTNGESISTSSPSPLPDPNKNDNDDKEMKELKEKWGKDSFVDI